MYAMPINFYLGLLEGEACHISGGASTEIILEYHHFIGVRHWEGLTEGRPPSGSNTVRKNSRLHQYVELCFSGARRHPLFVTPDFGARLLGARLLRFRSSLFRRYLSDLVRVWRRKQE